MSDDQESRLERYSFSRAGSFLRCPKAYDYRYNQKLLPIYNAPYLTRGTLIHGGLEAATLAQFHGMRGQDVRDAACVRIGELIKEYMADPFITALLEAGDENPTEDGGLRGEMNGLAMLAGSITDRVIRKYELDGDRWETIVFDGKPLIEKDLCVEIAGLPVHCKVDWVVRDTQTGLVYETDFKTRKTFQSTEDDEWNAQHAMYMHALRLYGIHVDGSMTWQIRASEPKVPKLNKPTKKAPVAMARSAIASNWETYEAALLEAGLDPADYAEMEDKLSDFEQLDQTLRTEQECFNIWNDRIDLLYNMVEGTLPKTRVLNPRTCKTCEYSELCMEQVRGHNIPESEYHLFGLTTREQRARKEYVDAMG